MGGPRSFAVLKNSRSRLVELSAATGLFLYAFPSATLTYGSIVLFHAALGVLLFSLLLPLLMRLARMESLVARFGWVSMGCGALLGLTLIYLGTPHRLRSLLYAHIFLCAAGALL